MLEEAFGRSLGGFVWRTLTAVAVLATLGAVAFRGVHGFSCSKTISRKRDHPQLFRHRTSFNGRGHAGAYSSATRATSINQQDRLLNSCFPTRLSTRIHGDLPIKRIRSSHGGAYHAGRCQGLHHRIRIS